MKIKSILNSKIQKLGWLAYINLKDQEIIIEHGKYVETNDNWIVEGVWDGPFNKGNFLKATSSLAAVSELKVTRYLLYHQLQLQTV